MPCVPPQAPSRSLVSSAVRTAMCAPACSRSHPCQLVAMVVAMVVVAGAVGERYQLLFPASISPFLA
eukprot:6100711-Pyramimonas_sp.AAC.1